MTWSFSSWISIAVFESYFGLRKSKTLFRLLLLLLFIATTRPKCSLACASIKTCWIFQITDGFLWISSSTEYFHLVLEKPFVFLPKSLRNPLSYVALYACVAYWPYHINIIYLLTSTPTGFPSLFKSEKASPTALSYLPLWQYHLHIPGTGYLCWWLCRWENTIYNW